MVGDVLRTTSPVPVAAVVPVPPFAMGRTPVTVATDGVSHEAVAPLDVKIFPVVPTVMSPVPPELMGRAVPDRERARVGEREVGVMGELVTVRKAGAVRPTWVT